MRRATAFVVATVATTLALVGLTGIARAESRAYVPAFSEVAKDKGPVFRDGCLIYTDAVKSPPCHYGEIGSEKKVFVFGDSHSLQWTPALINIAHRRGWELTMLMRKNCTAAIVDTDPVCNVWRRNALRRIKSIKPGLVFVSSNTARNVYVRHEGKRLSREASEPIFRKGMYRSLLQLRKAGAEVTVMRDLPMSKEFLPSRCVAANRENPELCSFEARRPLSEAYDFAAAKRFRRVQVIDPLHRVCPGGKCRAVQGNVLKYRDRGHISATYNRTLTNWLDARLQDPFRHRSATSS